MDIDDEISQNKAKIAALVFNFFKKMFKIKNIFNSLIKKGKNYYNKISKMKLSNCS